MLHHQMSDHKLQSLAKKSSRSSVKRETKTGDITSPCLRPIAHLKYSVNELQLFIHDLIFAYIFLTILSNFAFIPSLCILNHNAFLYILSNAILKSMNAQYRRPFSFIILLMTAFKMNIASTVDLSFLNPNCASLSISFSWIQFINYVIQNTCKYLRRSN